MMPSRARCWHATIVTLLTLAWLTSSHHCLLLGLAERSGFPPCATCHCSADGASSTAPAKSAPPSMLACCQGLLSPALDLAQSKVKFTPVLLGYQLAPIDQIVDFTPSQTASIDTEYDPGPPPKDCFVQTVLKRSLPENAPPAFV
jgi:hypothetical protein